MDEGAVGTSIDSLTQLFQQLTGEDLDIAESRAGWLTELGIKLARRYEQTGEMRDLEEAIKAAQQSLDLIPNNYPDRAVYLINLGSMLCHRHERTGKMQDLEEAIKAAQQAVDSTDNDHPNRIDYLYNRGYMLGRRYEQTGKMQDLEEAINAAQQAIDSISNDHPDRAARLNYLGHILCRRYERTGRMQELEEAIRAAQQAVDSAPNNYLDWATSLVSLGNALALRYERTGQMQDLQEAIIAAQQVVDSTPNNHPNWAAYLNSLGRMFFYRYERTGQMQDLEEAIKAAQQVVDSIPNDHPDRAASLSNLGSKLSSRYERTGQMQDIEEAIKAAQQAVDSTPNNHPNRAAILNSLGSILRLLYEQTGQMQDLEEAIKATQQAIGSTPNDHPSRAGYLNNLVNLLRHRYEQTRRMQDLEDASSCVLESWGVRDALPFHRVQAVAQGLRLLPQVGDVNSAAELARDVLDLLPAINKRFLDRSDQQFVMSTFAGIASASCAVMLQTQQTNLALEFLERGRAVILGQVIGDRSDFSSLMHHYPELAQTFENLRDEINAPIPTMDNSTLQWDVIRPRREVAREYEACIEKIRSLPNHERFLLGPNIPEMQDLAVDGSIIVVNIAELRSDAIIVSSAGTRTVNLPSQTAQEALRWLNKEWSTEPAELGEMNKEYRKYLAWLWNACVRQILEEGEITATPSGGYLPRIWWIGTGFASSMPFHAAGFHQPGSTENVFCRAISSYTPSFRALAHARGLISDEVAVHAGLLTVSMTTTPGGASPLPGVVREINIIKEMLAGRVRISELNQPSADEVVNGLQHHSIAHFACHGRTNHSDPSESALILQKTNGSGSFIQDLLTVDMVSDLRLKDARIAYLSACSTAENKASRLADEVIHIVSGFQVAGFSHCIGCLWPSSDEICVEVAKNFYSRLFQSGVEQRSSREVAAALHESVQLIKSVMWKQPLKWAQFVHYGA